MGVTGASGAIYPLRLLEKLRRPEVEIHLILSRSGEKTLFLETGQKSGGFEIAGRISPGRWTIFRHHLPVVLFRTDGMVIAPCSIHTMSSIAYGITSNLLTRAADVTLKERRRLILMVRESPLHLGHLQNNDVTGGDGRDPGAADSRVSTTIRRPSRIWSIRAWIASSI